MKAKLKKYRAAILGEFPELAAATFRRLNDGWDSVAVDVDDRLIFKFPRTKAARMALRKEAAVLAELRPALSLAVPDLRLHAGPLLFSSHAKLPGIQIEPETYANLPEAARAQLGADLARFYAELHALAPAKLQVADPGPISAWHVPKTVRKKALPLLPRKLRRAGREIIAAYEALPPDPCGPVFGFFDGHGWNMAFDPVNRRLNGVYDFADAGFGPLHREFISSNYIAADLTARIVSAYELLTGRTVNRRRIEILTGYHHLSELADFAEDPDLARNMRRDFKIWVDQRTDLTKETVLAG
jgi:hypothetical protein